MSNSSKLTRETISLKVQEKSLKLPKYLRDGMTSIRKVGVGSVKQKMIIGELIDSKLLVLPLFDEVDLNDYEFTLKNTNDNQIIESPVDITITSTHSDVKNDIAEDYKILLDDSLVKKIEREVIKSLIKDSDEKLMNELSTTVNDNVHSKVDNRPTLTKHDPDFVMSDYVKDDVMKVNRIEPGNYFLYDNIVWYVSGSYNRKVIRRVEDGMYLSEYIARDKGVNYRPYNIINRIVGTLLVKKVDNIPTDGDPVVVEETK